MLCLELCPEPGGGNKGMAWHAETGERDAVTSETSERDAVTSYSCAQAEKRWAKREPFYDNIMKSFIPKL